MPYSGLTPGRAFKNNHSSPHLTFITAVATHTSYFIFRAFSEPLEGGGAYVKPNYSLVTLLLPYILCIKGYVFIPLMLLFLAESLEVVGGGRICLMMIKNNSIVQYVSTSWFQVDQFSNIDLVALCQKLKSTTLFVIYTHTCMKWIYLNVLIEKYFIFMYLIFHFYILRYILHFVLISNISETDANWNVLFFWHIFLPEEIFKKYFTTY